MNAWTIAIAGADPRPTAALKVEDIEVDRISRDTDVATVSAHPSVSWDYGTVIEIYYQGVRIFYGRVRISEIDRTGRTNNRVYTVPGVGYWLERITFRQLWSMMSADGLGQVPSSRVILNCLLDTAPLSADGQLHEIIEYASARGAPLAFGSSGVAITLPRDEQRDLSCRQALERVLRMTPSVCEWTDYSTEVPEIHFGQGAPFSPARVERDTLAWRHDLVVPGLRIEIERINTYNGSQYRSLELLSAGDTDDVDAVFVSLPLAGSEYDQTMRTLDVVTEEIGDINAASWWAAKHPRLSGIAGADVTMVSAERSLLTPEDYPRISSTPLPDLTAAGCHARLETFRAVVDIVQRKDGEIVSTEYDVALEMEFVTTDATTRTYRWQESLDSSTAEPTPTGLAEALLAHWSVLYASGKFYAPIQDGIPHPGQTVYGTPIQTVHISARARAVSGVFGPPSQLSAQDFAAFLGGFRSNRKSLRTLARMEGTPNASSEDDKTSVAPVSSSDWAPGQYGRLEIDDGGKVSINPGEDLAEGDAAKFREITIAPSEEGGKAQTLKVLATEPVDAGTEDEEPDPCNDHPGGGDGVSGSSGGNPAAPGEGSNIIGVPSGGDGSAGAGCAAQCDL